MTSWTGNIKRKKKNVLAETISTISANNSWIEASAGKISKMKNIDDIQAKKTLFGDNVTVSQEDYSNLSELAKKQIAAENNVEELTEKVNRIEKDNEMLPKSWTMWYNINIPKKSNERGAFLCPEESQKRYAPEFKIMVVETMHKEKLSSYEAARQFEIQHQRISDWERIYWEEGKEAFYTERRGRKSTGRPAKLDKKVEEDLERVHINL